MSMYKKVTSALLSPGKKGPIEAAAPTQYVDIDSSDEKEPKNESIPRVNVTGFVVKAKNNRLDRWLDVVVRASGSRVAFCTIILGLLAWAFAGIHYGKTSFWAVVISDVQAILSYLYDSLLVRQQLNNYGLTVPAAASLRSRCMTNRRLLRVIMDKRAGKPTGIHEGTIPTTIQTTNDPGQHGIEDLEARFPSETAFGRFTTVLATITGHMAAVGFFVSGVLVWTGFGYPSHWSDSWLLYMNSASSALMVFIFAFLANIQERHTEYLQTCLNCIFEVDSAVETRLRTLAGGDTIPNPTVIIPPPKVNRVQRVIFYYADFVGTLVGVGILCAVLIAWVCVGPVMGFSANWWLLIGTYAGLIGLHDGFVLRNIQARLDEYIGDAFASFDQDDRAMLAEAGVSYYPTKEEEEEFDLQHASVNIRLSNRMGKFCSHEYTVVFGVILIVCLITGSSAMRWTVTGQLLCNVPPSIIESFLMMILITGHNLSELQRRFELHNIFVRRLALLSYVNGI